MNSDEFSGLRTPEAIAAGKQVVAVVAMHPALTRVLDASVTLIHSMTQIKMPTGILIQAEPGMGKTLLLELLKRKLESTAQEIEPKCIAVHVQLEAGADIYSLAGQTMTALGYPMMPSNPKLQVMNQIIDSGFARLRPKALLLDELQHLCEGKKLLSAIAATDWIKVRMDKHNCPVVGVGTPTIERLSQINPQFTSRSSASYVLTPFAFGDAWRQVLASFRQVVTAVDMTVVEGADAKMIHTATKGNMRSLKRLLMFAAMHASNRPDRKVLRQDLARGFVDATGQAGALTNPFANVRPE